MGLFYGRFIGRMGIPARRRSKQRENGYRLQGLIDTGNRLKDPLSGQPVCIVEREAVLELLEKAKEQRQIGFRSVGNTNAKILLVRMESLTLWGKEQKAVSGMYGLEFLNTRISTDGTYRNACQSGYFLGGIFMIMSLTVPSAFRQKILPAFRTWLFPEKQEVYYIGGSDILPPPLEMEEEARAIEQLCSEHNEHARKQLIEHNLRLVVYIAKKFDNTGVGVEDLISIGTIGLIKAINTFNPEKNIKLATYASRCIENEILMYLRRNNKTKLEVSIDEPLNVDWDGNELLLSDILGTEEDTIYKDMESEAEKSMLIRAVGRLSVRERRIVSMRFGLGTPDGEEMTQKEVADVLGISQSYISRLEKKIMVRLKKEIAKLE